MELFKNANFDFLGKQRLFIGISTVLMLGALASLVSKGGPRYGIDFKGGTVTLIRFSAKPDEDKIRTALKAKISGEVTVQPVVGTDEVIVGTELRSEDELEAARRNMIETLNATYGAKDGKPDFHAIGYEALVDRIQEPFQRANIVLSIEQLRAMAREIVDYRDSPPRSGLIKGFDDLRAVAGVTPAMVSVLKQEFGLGPFVVRQFELVGPKIGQELRWQAIYATLLALAGMLGYIAFRFETIYGVAAVLAVFHDTLVTIGFFSIFDKEISLTVVAALLTLVGYSMNDTIVVFDRIRENLKTMRKESFANLVNASINQTLSRTILTSGLTFLSVMALWLFGGPVLNGFSFALVAGIIVGSYSSIFIASPILIYWQNALESRKRSSAAPAPVAREATKSAVRETVKKTSSKAAK